MSKKVNIMELAKVIRSKNAGGFHLTFDLIFEDPETYKKVKKAGTITKELIGKLYNLPLEHVTDLVYYDPGNAIKATIRRPIPCGAFGDTDVYGCQQHAPLLQIEIPWH